MASDASGDIFITFGSFPLLGDVRGMESLSQADTTTPYFNLDATLRDKAPASTASFVTSLTGGGLKFPLLTDPMAAFGLLVGYSVLVLVSSIRRGSRVSAVILAAVSALIVVGVLESPLDFPRIALLFYLLLFAGIVRSGAGAR